MKILLKMLENVSRRLFTSLVVKFSIIAVFFGALNVFAPFDVFGPLGLFLVVFAASLWFIEFQNDFISDFISERLIHKKKEADSNPASNKEELD